MSNDPKADLMYAILAMDSYNRGYGSGINGLENKNNITKIGGYLITNHSNDVQNASLNDAFAAGFYAIAYKNAATGETVISYRGTDFNGDLDFSPLSSTLKGGSDATNGYGIALGATQGSVFDFATEQARLLVDFYRAVTGQSDTQSAANVTLTGHSLGGGLAGYVSATSGTQSVVFDHLPFDVSGVVRAQALGVTAQLDKVRGYFTQGEFLQSARSGDLQTALGGVIGGIASLTLGPVVGGVVAAYGGSLGGATAALEMSVEKTPLHSNYDLGSPFSFYHSMNLLTLLLWAKAENKTDWTPVAQELWSAYFDETIAAAIPMAKTRTVKETGTALATMQSAIAYSAIDEGERPFGDTAIHAMFNDAGDLGRALKGTNVPAIIRDNAAAIAKMLVQYAGKLALGDVEAAQDDAQVTEGILKASDNGGLLSIDMSDARWSVGAANDNNRWEKAA